MDKFSTKKKTYPQILLYKIIYYIVKLKQFINEIYSNLK